MSHKLINSLIIMLVITACAPATSAPANSATSLPTTPAPLDQKVDVGGYSLCIICTGQGTPTVVIDSAFAEPALESGYWIRTRYETEKTTQICIYDRAGLGSSDTPSHNHRTSQNMVKDLHALLVNANIPGPYVLVGRNLGGFNVRIYASQFPDEVVGIVLLDSLHPDYEPETIAALPPEAPDEAPILEVMRNEGFYPDPDFNDESIDFAASVSQARAVTQLGDLPVVVLTSGWHWFSSWDISPEVDAKIDQVWYDLQDDLVKLSSHGTHIVARQLGSDTLVDEHQLLTDAILELVSEARK